MRTLAKVTTRPVEPGWIAEATLGERHWIAGISEGDERQALVALVRSVANDADHAELLKARGEEA